MTARSVDLARAQRLIAPLLGEPAWRVEQGYGSYVTMEFGPPLPPDTGGFVHGRWHLWIQMAAWRLETADRVIAGSEDQGLQQALSRLEGRPLTAVTIQPPSLAAVFDFDGLRLVTFPIYRSDPEDGEFDHWLLWLGNGEVLVAASDLTVEPSSADGTASPSGDALAEDLP
ncbi:hypothetical protein ACFYNO_11750 [Kitasatospora sp. NPDC006697]|uniref:hypothetical protein n=1 Tax=Kitasatospora sp. NPDC006697 TaxID=3364020 RepID=UPI00367522D9